MTLVISNPEAEVSTLNFHNFVLLVVSQALDNISVQKMHIINDKEIPIIYLYRPTGKNLRLCLPVNPVIYSKQKQLNLKKA